MSSDGRDATLDGLIRQSLAKTGGPRENCLGPAVLAAYYERSLDLSEVGRCESHLSECAPCREQLAIMARAEPSRERSASHRAWLWDWRLLASAATALVVVTVWGVRRPASTSTGLRPARPLVAMSRPEQPPASQAPEPPQGTASAQPSAKAPPSDHRAILIAPPALDRLAPKTETSPPERAAGARNEIQQSPLNGRNYNDLLKLKQEARAAEPSRSMDAKKEVAGNGPAAAAGSDLPAASRQAQGAGSASGLTGAILEGEAVPAARDRNQLQSAGRETGVRSAVGGTLGQVAAQRSASTIIQTPDPKVLWRLAAGNFVERTEDGGATWHGQVADAEAMLTAGSAPSSKVCWVVGKSGAILVTKDAVHWKKVPPPVPADFVAVEAKSGSSATVTALDGQKFSTENAGKKWVPIH